jgi:hypothetical protein
VLLIVVQPTRPCIPGHIRTGAEFPNRVQWTGWRYFGHKLLHSGVSYPTFYFPSVQLTLLQTAAGIISLLNDFRISQCEPPLGFLNPLLYLSASKGFNAITSGSNPGCGTPGFSAMAGWNPVCSAFGCISAWWTILIVHIRTRSQVLGRPTF